MSNEMKDWLKEVEDYEKEVYDDFYEQNVEVIEKYGQPPIFLGVSTPEYISYLLSRMRSEGLPAKEPRND